MDNWYILIHMKTILEICSLKTPLTPGNLW